MRPLFAKALPSIFVGNLADDHDKIKDRISKHFGEIAAVARHPRKSMMLALPNKTSPMGSSRGPNSALSSQRQLQLIPSFEKVETPLGSTETVVISLREMEEGSGGVGAGVEWGETTSGVIEDEEEAPRQEGGRENESRSATA